MLPSGGEFNVDLRSFLHLIVTKTPSITVAILNKTYQAHGRVKSCHNGHTKFKFFKKY